MQSGRDWGPRLDGVLHNAGLLGDVCPMSEQNPQVWQDVMQVNVNATFMLTQAPVSYTHLEGDRKHKQVAVDGYRTRYPGGVHCWMHSERRSDTQFGWHRRIHILSHERYMGQDVFYVPENT